VTDKKEAAPSVPVPAPCRVNPTASRAAEEMKCAGASGSVGLPRLGPAVKKRRAPAVTFPAVPAVTGGAAVPQAQQQRQQPAKPIHRCHAASMLQPHFALPANHLPRRPIRSVRPMAFRAASNLGPPRAHTPPPPRCRVPTRRPLWEAPTALRYAHRREWHPPLPAQTTACECSETARRGTDAPKNN
jgi:hypothetical protein